MPTPDERVYTPLGDGLNVWYVTDSGYLLRTDGGKEVFITNEALDKLASMRHLPLKQMLCDHVVAEIPGDYYATDEWRSDFARCARCGKSYGEWYCPNSPDHLCHYENGGPDDCDYCHMPDERK